MTAPDIHSLAILYRDEALVAVHKPAGLLVHRNAHAGQEPFALQLLRDQLGCRVYPVHRLDRPTSGLLVMALSSDTASLLARQFASRTVSKTYIAIVRGFTPPRGTIDSPLLTQSGAVQEAQTDYERLDTVELPAPVGRYETARFSLVRIRPRTGRTHQIRRHFAHIRHPLIGDVLRGDGRQNRFFREYFGIHRLLLASTELQFIHPHDGRSMALSCPLEETMADVCRRIGWNEYA